MTHQPKDRQISTIRKGILTCLANSYVDPKEERLFTLTRSGSDKSIALILKNRMIHEAYIDRGKWVLFPQDTKVPNPFYCNDIVTIRNVLNAMVKEGLLDYKTDYLSERMGPYFITKEGAKIIGDKAVVKAFDTDISTAEVSQGLANNQYQPPAVPLFSLKNIQSALATVMGGDNPEVARILELIQGNSLSC